MKRRRTDVVTRAVQKKARSRGIKVYEDGSFAAGPNFVFDPDTGTLRPRRKRRR